jgi:hypothetical protein
MRIVSEPTLRRQLLCFPPEEPSGEWAKETVGQRRRTKKNKQRIEKDIEQLPVHPAIDSSCATISY